ncbi:hypothetical protein [Yersinia phage YpP-R]|uniref:Uncharacterized protein n=3 Tax=Teseptimavirus TaxID=110456 RepID=I6QAG6_9CAUD|nr:hypothetical protein HOS93_gp45 [Yersinia phage YpP-Y]YP_009799274.1 hypothetical protein HOS94_gp01 [Yersinia phage YpsP-G]YP_009799325.1 hypothetical protein HOS94_gp52 [Yersinia phage YpsP-G]AFK13443.1 hypothetical protein [Yersinia phage YpP-R]AFK13390.1 hypothetical protein [Yersinia phage YpP-Y]AFK13488.1 hypothetical protein [Yersinia phage YpsP-G]AFK13539.1 hypothetical protein [Yersinia phage YpsP-G]
MIEDYLSMDNNKASLGVGFRMVFRMVFRGNFKIGVDSWCL